MFTKKAQQSYCEVQYQPGDWLVFGSETSGLPDSMLAESKRNLRVPMFEQVRSLNLASTVALASYEVARQNELVRVETGAAIEPIGHVKSCEHSA